LDAIRVLGELEDRRPFDGRPLRLPVAEDRRDPNSGVELLCHDESSHGGVRTQGALFNRLALDVSGRRIFRARVFLACARVASQDPRPSAKARRIASAARLGSGASMTAETTADRKSTRLNSSHGSISYAVFCLKKKKKKNKNVHDIRR